MPNPNLTPGILVLGSGGGATINEPLLAFDFENNLTNSSTSGLTLSKDTPGSPTYSTSSIVGSNSVNLASNDKFSTSVSSTLDYDLALNDSWTIMLWYELVTGSESTNTLYFSWFESGNTAADLIALENNTSGFYVTRVRDSPDLNYFNTSVAEPSATTIGWHNFLIYIQKTETSPNQIFTINMWRDASQIFTNRQVVASAFVPTGANPKVVLLHPVGITSTRMDSYFLWKNAAVTGTDATYFYNSGTGRTFSEYFNYFAA